MTASTTSAYLVHIPIRAEIHSQKMEPAPPKVTAQVMPAMLPVPTVAASAVVTAWKGDTAPSCYQLGVGDAAVFPFRYGLCRDSDVLCEFVLRDALFLA